MIQRTLQHIADMIGSGSEVLLRDQGMNIKGVSTDTRSILEGSLFIPIQGPDSMGMIMSVKRSLRVRPPRFGAGENPIRPSGFPS
ncbi:MAG: hypothetical protein K0Q81_1173 [Paenibacillus sp.]|nr:hypothetical protein [Paenibacillus sp.]